MAVWAVVVGICVVVLLKLLKNYVFHSDKMSGIPGPNVSPWWQLLSPPDTTKAHLRIHQLQKKFGPIVKLQRLGGEVAIILSNYEFMHKVLMKDGKAFSGRPATFRLQVALANTGILQNIVPNTTWKGLRKTSQKHLRQFGDGLSRLETIIKLIAEDMFSKFAESSDSPFDPHKVVFDTALNSIAFLMIGERTQSGDYIVEKMRAYEELFIKILPATAPIKLRMLDLFPWIRHFGWPTWKYFTELLQLEADIWRYAVDFAENKPEVESICKLLRSQVASGDGSLTEADAIKTTLSLLLAGVTTTSNTFYGAINILAHHPNVQEKISFEVRKIKTETGREVSLQDRPNMPYSRAVLLEILRYTSVVALGVPHMCLEDTELGGHIIPAGTRLTMSIWGLHHDEDFWENPYEFNPQRFLDADGDMVPADHPNRKNLMPFGAGTRVCLGESLAMTRLFLWLTSLIDRFTVEPAKGNERHSADARTYNFGGVLRPTPYEVIFIKRQS